MATHMRRPRNDFAAKQTNHDDPGYDLIDDLELIEASFAQQYGIRLRIEDDMQWGEYISLLSGLNSKSPLGEVVAIRLEKDPKTIKRFTKAQHKIRNDYRKKQARIISRDDYNRAMKQFEAMFIAIGKEGKA